MCMDMHMQMCTWHCMCTASTRHVHCIHTACALHAHRIHTACALHVHVHRSFWVLIALAVPVLALPLALLGPPSAQGAAERETTAFLQETNPNPNPNSNPNLQP